MTTYLTEAQFYKYASPVSRYLNASRPLRAWGVHAGSVYKSEQTGSTTVLFEDGADLGAPEATLVAVDANEEWFYDSATDTTYLFNDSVSPNTEDIQAGEDHATYVADIFLRASQLIDRELDATHVISLQPDTDGNYEELIIMLTAYKVAEIITVASAPELSLLYAEKLTNIDDSGLLDRLREGNLKFAYEIDQTSSKGEITQGTFAGDLRLHELRGDATGVQWDDILVKITKAGAIGTATFSTWVADSDTDTLQALIQTEDEIVNGLFQHLGYGVYGRFVAGSVDGLAVLNDSWGVEVRGEQEETSNPTIKSVFGGRGEPTRSSIFGTH